MKKIIAINAGPRTGYNTDLLIKEAAKRLERQMDLLLVHLII